MTGKEKIWRDTFTVSYLRNAASSIQVFESLAVLVVRMAVTRAPSCSIGGPGVEDVALTKKPFQGRQSPKSRLARRWIILDKKGGDPVVVVKRSGALQFKTVHSLTVVEPKEPVRVIIPHMTGVSNTHRFAKIVPGEDSEPDMVDQPDDFCDIVDPDGSSPPLPLQSAQSPRNWMTWPLILNPNFFASPFSVRLIKLSSSSIKSS